MAGTVRPGYMVTPLGSTGSGHGLARAPGWHWRTHTVARRGQGGWQIQPRGGTAKLTEQVREPAPGALSLHPACQGGGVQR